MDEMVTITIELEEDVLCELLKFCAENGTTIDQLCNDFLEFCIKPENFDLVRAWVEVVKNNS